MEDEVIDFDDEEEINAEDAIGLGRMDQFLQIFDPGFRFGNAIGYDCNNLGMCTCKAGTNCDNLRKSGKCRGTVKCDAFGDCICPT